MQILIRMPEKESVKFEYTNLKTTKMKKVLLTALTIFAFGFANAQDMKFGVKAGLMMSNYDTHAIDNKYGGYYNYYNNYYYGNGADESNVGVYVGGLLDFELVGKFRLQPELTLSVIPGDAGYVAVGIPVLAKYSFFDKFYAMAGPGLNYAVNGDDDQFSPSFDIGASYDVMEDFYVEVRGDIGLGGYLGSNVHAGVGYRF